MKLALHFSADYLDLRRWLIVVDVFVRSRGQRDWLEGRFRATNVSPVGQQSSGKGRLGRRDRIGRSNGGGRGTPTVLDRPVNGG